VELDGSLARLQSGQGSAGQLLRDSAQYDKLRSEMADLRRSIADLRAAEAHAVGQSVRRLERRALSLIESVDAFNRSPAMTTSQVYDNFNGVARELQDTVRTSARIREIHADEAVLVGHAEAAGGVWAS